MVKLTKEEETFLRMDGRIATAMILGQITKFDTDGYYYLLNYLKGEIKEELALRGERNALKDFTPQVIKFGGYSPLTLDGKTEVEFNDVHRALLLGGSGQGKSFLLYSIIFQLLMMNPKKYLELVYINNKGGKINKKISEFQQVTGYGETVESLKLELVKLQKEMREREILFKEQGILSIETKINPEVPHKYLVIDDYQYLIGGLSVEDLSEVNGIMGELVDNGERLGLHVIIATQNLESLTKYNKYADLKVAFNHNSSEELETFGLDKDSILPKHHIYYSGVVKHGGSVCLPVSLANTLKGQELLLDILLDINNECKYFNSLTTIN